MKAKLYKIQDGAKVECTPEEVAEALKIIEAKKGVVSVKAHDPDTGKVRECTPEETAKVLEGLGVLEQMDTEPGFDTVEYVKKMFSKADFNNLIQTPNPN